MRTAHYKLAVTLMSTSALLLFNELDAYYYFGRRTPARAPREQDADAQTSSNTPAQVEGAPRTAAARRLDGRQRQAQARQRRGRADHHRSFVEGRQEAFRGRTYRWRCVIDTPQRSHQS